MLLLERSALLPLLSALAVSARYLLVPPSPRLPRQQLGFENHGVNQQTKATMSDPHRLGSQTYVLHRFGSELVMGKRGRTGEQLSMVLWPACCSWCLLHWNIGLAAKGINKD